MSATAIQSLSKAIELIDANDHPLDLPADRIRDEIARALASLQQGPMTYDDITLHARLNREIGKHGSAAAAARAWGVTRQTVYAAQAGPKPVPPSILRAIGLRRVTGRRMYQEV